MKLTPWFPADVKPIHVGIYERHYGDCGEGWYCFWNGKWWMAAERTPEKAAQNGSLSSGWFPWRGFTEKMNNQPEALRLADRLSGHGGLTFVEMHAAAAELRRLHAEVKDQIGRATTAEAALQMTQATHALKIAAVEAQRDALLEALELAADFLEHSTEFRIGHPGFEGAQAKARAAIKAVEENT